MKLDLHKLINVVPRNSGEFQAQCPACAERGQDTGGRNHLRIFSDGRFGCALHPKNKQHAHRILVLAGIGKHASPTQRKRAATISDNKSIKLNHGALRNIIRKYASPPRELLINENPHPFVELLGCVDRRYFLSCLFRPNDLLWIGNWFDTGKAAHAKHWQHLEQYMKSEQSEIAGSFTTPSTWKPHSISRRKDQVLRKPYVILDFDEIDGKKPDNAEDILRLFHQSIAIIRWLRDELKWDLAAIVMTGNKGLHAWFHMPSDPSVVPSLKRLCKELGIDDTLDNPSQPCRLPGVIHQKSGNLSRVLWLQRPDAIR